MSATAPATADAIAPPIEPPLGLLAELTHRCPLRCPYCSNPEALTRAAQELDTATWARVFREAAALGVLQLHLSGGEPTARRDLPELVRAASEVGLYTNLITAGVLLDAAKLDALAAKIKVLANGHTTGDVLQLGELIFREVYGSQGRMLHKGGSQASLRRLAAHPDVPCKVTTLWRAVSVYEMSLRLPQLVTSRSSACPDCARSSACRPTSKKSSSPPPSVTTP